MIMGLSTRLSEFLLKKEESQPAPALDVRFVPELPDRILDADEPHELGEPLLESLDAEGQCFVICYINSKGVHSTRRITMRALKRTSEMHILLVARCAETRELMGFQANRIRYCMDINGEKYEPPYIFLAEIFGLAPADAQLLVSERPQRIDTWPPPDEAYSQLRHQLRNELTLLVAMSECDGHVSQTESDAIIQHIRQRADALGLPLGSVRMQRLKAYIRRLRPTADQIRASIDEVSALPLSAQREFLQACHNVVEADGALHEQELALLEQIRSDLAEG
jgi:uncharacterized tellurite resistance protein B-like protein